MEYEGEFHERRESMLNSDSFQSTPNTNIDAAIKEVIDMIESDSSDDVLPGETPISALSRASTPHYPVV